MRFNTYFLVSLGCAKNTVDSSSMAELLNRNGYTQVAKLNQARFIIVNTCGFIQSARQESIQMLKELARKKRPGQKLVATGCMTELYHQMVVEQVPELDGLLGTRRWMDIVNVVEGLRSNNLPTPLYHLPGNCAVSYDERGIPRIAQQGGSAYLKIADGCHRPCAFCTIPLIKGPTVSRPQTAILEEAIMLQESGAKEIILIAQDTTAYGHDRGEKEGLSSLLEALVKTVPRIPWVRILYAYPGCITDRLISVMAENPQILPYLDIPLQHAHPDILRRMKRPADMKWVYRTLDKMRKKMPQLAIRTTFIVGYPGETEKEFQVLLNFVREIQFDRIGVFPFSFEPGTASEELGDPVLSETKQKRLERLMLQQQEISLSKNRSFIGKALPVLIEGYDNGISAGRSYRDAPEIDGLVFIEGKLPVGEIVNIRVTGALTYDLIGNPI